MKLRLSPGPLLFSLMIGAAVVSSAAALLAGPSAVANAKDAQKADRTVVSASGVDERTSLGPALAAAGDGIVEPADRETKVAAFVPGRIASIVVHEGDVVPAGAVLVELDHEPEAAALAAAVADVASAQADLDKSVRGQRREDIEAAINDAEAATARARSSADVYRRLKLLVVGVSTTGDEIEKAERQAESDQRTADAAEARRKLAVAGSRYEDIAAARARLASAQAKRDQAQATLGRLTVRAPIDGEILQLKYRAGEYETPGGDSLVVMGDTRTLRARIDVDERDIGRVVVGSKGYVVADAFPGKKFAAHVVERGYRMGRKNVRTDDPTERIDTKILETVLTLDEHEGLVPGLRVTGYILPPGAP